MTIQALDIQPYHPADEAALIQLWRDCGLTRPWNDPVKDIARKATVQADLFLVGRIDGAIVATVMGGYDGHCGWVNYLAVSPGHQRRGYAKVLMHALEARLLAMGCPKINLLIRSGNLGVQGFYKSLGFQLDEVVNLGKRLIPDT